ncbi:MAG: hypothetical protein MPJ50_18535, partial [Pirellulales bacterium]|nr:hypothetical protein [Pirellulales bacterium]
AGSFVVKTAQAFRAHVMDMFEPQDHPDDFAYPGATPTPPYDIAGWTLAYSMGVEFDRILDGFDGPFQRLDLLASPTAGKVTNADDAAGFYLSTRINDSYRAVNRLLAAGAEIDRLEAPSTLGDRVLPAGTFYIANTQGTADTLNQLAQQLGVSFHGAKASPTVETKRLHELRVGLWDRTGGSMPSGWTRWILEQFEFPFEVVYAGDLESEELRSKYDVLIFVTGALSDRRGRGLGISHLGDFLKQGGTVLAIGSSTSLGNQLELPFGSHLVQINDDGEEQPLTRSEFYIPGSLLRVRVDNSQPLAWGLDEEIDVMFANGSPTFRLLDANEDAEASLASIAWFDTDKPLRSGWAWGQEHLNGGVSIIDASVGEGRLALFGPEVLFRGQPHGTFKFVFNGILNANPTPAASDEGSCGR